MSRLWTQPLRRCSLAQHGRILMRTAVYVRVSTQRHSHAPTMAPQLVRLRTVLESEGEERWPERMFRDDGDRGGTLNRPG